jgi:hypothetical protein
VNFSRKPSFFYAAKKNRARFAKKDGAAFAQSMRAIVNLKAGFQGREYRNKRAGAAIQNLVPPWTLAYHSGKTRLLN